MPDIDHTRLDAALDALPKAHPGPGGVAGVMKDGQIVAARAWGYASLETGTPLSTATRLPICSISKQFTCGVLLATVGDPAKLDAGVAEFLPRLETPLPTVKQLCDNQSGLRDYWALTILQGAKAEQTFRREDALLLIAKMKTGHFGPGTSYSYNNSNFRMVGELIERATGETLETLYQRHIWGPAGMTGAALTADTRHPADGVTGYEGSDATGFFPADNGIYWRGDAGISASLDDMLAYEAWIDATRDDAASLYRQLSAAPSFVDGAPASYGYGLSHEEIGGAAFTGHAGALRGFRAYRMNSREERLSVVVLFNHECSAHGAATRLALAAMGKDAPEPAPIAHSWDGQWLDAGRGMLARIETGRRTATLQYGTGDAELTSDGEALRSDGLVITRAGDGLTMLRPDENTTRKLTPLPEIASADATEIAGRYRSDELDAEMEIEARDGGVYAVFRGMLGEGRRERMAAAGKDAWRIATRRSMDAPAPGDWTLVIGRDAAGAVSGATLSCWLARGVPYTRL